MPILDPRFSHVDGKFLGNYIRTPDEYKVYSILGLRYRVCVQRGSTDWQSAEDGAVCPPLNDEQKQLLNRIMANYEERQRGRIYG